MSNRFDFEIETYEKILNGELKSFSPYFFNLRYRKKRIKKILKYLIEEKLKITPNEALETLNLKVIKEYKLLNLLKYVEKPVELDKNDLTYLVYYAYPELNPPSDRELTIMYYQKVLREEKRNFPKNYFIDGLYGETRAKYCIEYLCEEVLKLDKKDIPSKLTIEVLTEYKLKILLTALYFSMHDLITSIYLDEFNSKDF